MYLNLYNTYLNSLASHPIIAQHLLVSINVAPSNDTFVNYAGGSNRPLSYEWGKCAICAVGTDIYFDDKKHDSGTSLAAPIVSALCTIINQATDGTLTAPHIIEKIKSNAIRLHDNGGDQEMFGCGLINPLGTIEDINSQ